VIRDPNMRLSADISRIFYVCPIIADMSERNSIRSCASPSWLNTLPVVVESADIIEETRVSVETCLPCLPILGLILSLVLILVLSLRPLAVVLQLLETGHRL